MIKRYDIEMYNITAELNHEIIERDTGEYVLYEDHLKELKQLETELEKWKSIAKQINTDWIPANKKLSDKNNKLTDQMLEMYDYNAVEEHGLRIAKGCAEIARKQAQRERKGGPYAEGWADCADEIDLQICKKYRLEES